VRRILITLPVIWVVVSVVFLLIHIVPGDPIVQMLARGRRRRMCRRCGMRMGWMHRWASTYLHYWRGVVHGDLGQSLRLHDSVTHLVAQRYPYTLGADAGRRWRSEWAVGAGGGGFGAASWAMAGPGAGVVSLGGLSFPNFALGPILILVFSIRLGWLPVSGCGNRAGVGCGVLGVFGAAGGYAGQRLAGVLTRMVRTAMLEELGQDYIRTARAKGLSERAVVYRHALGNALIPVLTVVGCSLAACSQGDCDRDGLQLAGDWAAHAVGDLQPRLCVGAGMHSGSGADVRGREPADGRGVYGGEPADEELSRRDCGAAV